MIYTKQELLEKFVEISVKSDDEFLIIRETLTRIGTPKDNQLLQQCYIFHKQGRYYIVHYRHMLNLVVAALFCKVVELSHGPGHTLSRFRGTISEAFGSWVRISFLI